MILHEPQLIDPQSVHPYARSNPYGTASVVERPYVPMQQSALPPVPMQQRHAAHNSAAIGSVIVGALAFCLSIVGVIPGAPFFYYSAGGVLAIVGGARALARRRSGFGTALGAPIAAIILGSLAVVFMIAGFAIHTTLANSGTGSYDSKGQTNSDTGATSGSSSEGLPGAPAFASDPALSQYETSASKIATSIYASFNGGQVSTSGRAGQWPGTLMESAQGMVEFPNGTAAATIPSDEIINYVRSSDGKYFDLAVSGGTHQEIAIYDSATNQFTWLCNTGAAASCPKGGLDPNSSGNTTLNS